MMGVPTWFLYGLNVLALGAVVGAWIVTESGACIP